MVLVANLNVSGQILFLGPNTDVCKKLQWYLGNIHLHFDQIQSYPGKCRPILGKLSQTSGKCNHICGNDSHLFEKIQSYLINIQLYLGQVLWNVGDVQTHF